MANVTYDLRLLPGLNGTLVGRARKVNCISPLHTDSDPSMLVYADGAWCAGCGRSFSAETVAAAVTGLEGEALDDVLAKVPPPDAAAERMPKVAPGALEPLPAALADVYHEALTERARAYLHGRGLTDKTIDRFKLGYNVCYYAVPVFYPQGLITFRYRVDADVLPPDFVRTRKYSGVTGRNVYALYPLREALDMVKKQNRLVVVEGELDALRLIQEGIPALSGTNGASQLGQFARAAAEANVFPNKRNKRPPLELLIASDMDDAGHKGAAALAEALGGFDNVRVRRLSWLGAKDVTDLYNAGGRLPL